MNVEKYIKTIFDIIKNLFLQEEFLISYLSENIFTPDESTKSVLELGCGYGRITKLLLTKFPNNDKTVFSSRFISSSD